MFIDTDTIRTIVITGGASFVVLIPGVRTRSTYAIISQCEELVAFIKRQLSTCADNPLILIFCDLGLKVTEYVREGTGTGVKAGNFAVNRN